MRGLLSVLVRSVNPPPGSTSPAAFLALIPVVLVVLVAVAAVSAQGQSAPADASVTDRVRPPEPLTEAELRGRQIYREGTSPRGGEVVALMGRAGIEVPATALPCASCHGRDGAGRPEGGVEPSNITWPILTKPYGGRTPSGREHPPYEPTDLVRAIAMGVDPAGNELDLAMPRYRLSRDDMADLVAYLQRLGTDPDPGVGEDTVTVATILPPAVASLEDLGRVQRAALDAALAEVDTAGGLYGRSLELVTVQAGDTAEITRWRLETFLERERPFALVAPFLGGAEDEILELAAEWEVPVIGPLTPRPRTGYGGAGSVFYLLSGPEQQARALVRHAAILTREEGGDAPAWALLAPAPPPTVQPDVEPEDEPEVVALLDAVDAEAEALNLPAPRRLRYADGAHDAASLVRRLQADGVEDVFLLAGTLEVSRLLAEASQARWGPRFHLLTSGALGGVLAGRVGVGFPGRLYAATPLPPASGPDRESAGDDSEAGAEAGDGNETEASSLAPAAWRRLAREHGLPARHLATQRAVLGAVEVLVEGLRRSGRSLTRERLVGELEKLYRFDARFVPPVSFDPNRRIGALGAHIVVVEPSTGRVAPAVAWLDLGTVPGG